MYMVANFLVPCMQDLIDARGCAEPLFICGNLSYRVKADEVALVKENFKPKEWQPIGTTVPNFAGVFD